MTSANQNNATAKVEPTGDGYDRLMSPHHAAFEMLNILIAHSQVHTNHPDRMAKSQPHMIQALEITLNVHRRGGATPGQMVSLAVSKTKIEALR